MTKAKQTDEKEGKVFQPKHRRSTAVTAAFYGCVALWTLYSSILKFKAYLQGEVLDWWNSWWVAAIAFTVFLLMLADSLQYLFTRLVLSKKGVSFYQSRKSRHVAWEQVDHVGIVRSQANGNKEYALFLKPSDPEEAQANFQRARGLKQVIPLTLFVDEWFVSEVREEIKRLNPSLPIQ